jgi:hypothetical protein|eukprot:COSAG06_NODE_1110_length_10653_cov_16.756490_4_plen_175_part_00
MRSRIVPAHFIWRRLRADITIQAAAIAITRGLLLPPPPPPPPPRPQWVMELVGASSRHAATLLAASLRQLIAFACTTHKTPSTQAKQRRARRHAGDTETHRHSGGQTATNVPFVLASASATTAATPTFIDTRAFVASCCSVCTNIRHDFTLAVLTCRGKMTIYAWWISLKLTDL